MAETLQVLKGTSAQPRGLFYSDGALTDIDSSAVPVVTITRPDGTAGPPSGTVTRVSVGTYTFTLAATATAELTLYTVTWTGSIGTQPQTITTFVEVVGEFLFTLAALRAVKIGDRLAFTDAAAFPNQTLLDVRAEVTDDFEARTGWSFVPRFARQILDGDGRNDLILDHLKCSKLLSVTVNGVAQSVGNYTLDRSGVLRATSNYLAAGWFPAGVGNVIVEYAHGHDRPPPAVSRVALARAAMLLAPSQVGSTAAQWTTPDGTSFSYDPAGRSLG